MERSLRWNSSPARLYAMQEMSCIAAMQYISMKGARLNLPSASLISCATPPDKAGLHDLERAKAEDGHEGTIAEAHAVRLAHRDCGGRLLLGSRSSEALGGGPIPRACAGLHGHAVHACLFLRMRKEKLLRAAHARQL
eukprot:216552-Pelagomonas_calceolata.AAC.4